jgi:uncharacterized protein (TIGR02145 family)
LPTNLTLMANPETICAGETVTLTASATNGARYSLNGTAWQPDNTFSVMPTVNTSYTLYVKTAAGCSATAVDAAVVTIYPVLSPGSITTASTTTMVNVNPNVTIGSSATASGGNGSFTYEWVRTGTGSATLTGSNATYNLSSNASNYATPGTYYFNRYVKAVGCSSAWVAAQGTYTLVVDIDPQGGCTYTAPTLAGNFEDFPVTYSAATYVSLTDARDDKVYPVVKIGERWVMARNLNYQKDLTWQANANSPSTVTGDSDPELIGHFWCPGGDNGSTATTSPNYSCEAWGALYSWETAMMVDGKWSDDNRNSSGWTEPAASTYTTSSNTNNGGRGANGHGICPPNWYIPTDAEWGDLLNAMESGSGTTHNTGFGSIGTNAGARGKSKCMCIPGSCATDQNVSWDYYSTTSVRGIDVYGFRALPTGYRRDTGSDFNNRGKYAYFWSSSSAGPGAWFRRFSHSSYQVYRASYRRSYGFSVRCIRDINCSDTFSPGTITTDTTTTIANVNPNVTIGSASAATGGYGEITYEWRRTGTGSATLTGSNATYNLSSDASNYATPGTYYFNRYAHNEGCNTAWTAAQGTCTLVVDIDPQGGCTYTAPTLAGNFASFDPGNVGAATYVSLTDARDNKVYPVVKISSGTYSRWVMARNLNYQGTTNSSNTLTWQANVGQSEEDWAAIGHFWCPGGYSGANVSTSTLASCEVWGALYSWRTAMMVDGRWTSSAQTSSSWSTPDPADYGMNFDSGNPQNLARSDDGAGTGGRGICPPSWHIPTDLEWGELLNAMESGAGTTHNSDVSDTGLDAGVRGRAACTTPASITTGDMYVNDTQANWYYHATNSGTDAYGFRVLPAGYRSISTINNGFAMRGNMSRFWSSSVLYVEGPWIRVFYRDYATVSREPLSSMYGISVRCIRDIDYTEEAAAGSNSSIVAAGGSNGVMTAGATGTNFASTATWSYGGYIWSDRVVGAPEGSNDVERYYYNWASAQTACPSGWALPTQAQFDALMEATNSTELSDNWGYGGYAFGSSMLDVDLRAYYWSSTESGNNAYSLYYGGNELGVNSASKNLGYQVRCVKEIDCTEVIPDGLTLTASPATICAGELSTLAVSSAIDGAASYSLDGTSWQTTTTFSVSPGSTTAYTLHVRSDVGCSATRTNAAAVTVNPLPSNPMLTANPPAICAGATVMLTASATNGAQYRLDGTNWQASTEFPVSPESTTAYTLYVKTAAGCSATLKNAATVTVRLLPTVSAVTSPAICYNATATLSATPAGAGTITPMIYTWNIGGVSSTTTANTKTSPALTATTTYTVQLTNTYGCVGAVVVGTITVHPQFTAGAIASIGQALCTGGMPTVIGNTTAASGGSGTISYQWYKNGSIISGATAATYTPPASDAAVTAGATITYTRRAAAALCGTQAVSAGNWVLTVHRLPVVSAVTSPAICYGATAVLSATLGAGTTTPMTYTWNIGGVSNTTTAGSMTSPPLTANTTYTVQLTNAYGCVGAVSAVRTVTVHPQFTAGTIASTGQRLCVGGTPTVIGNITAASGGSGAIGYQWYKNGSPISGATAAVYTPPASDATVAGIITYTRRANDASCAGFTQSAGNWILNVVADPTVTVSSAESVCYNTAPSVMTATVSGGTGTPSYQWYRNGVTLGSGARASTYSPGALTATATYSVAVTQTGSGCSATSGNIVKTVYPQFTAGAIATASTTTMLNVNPNVTTGNVSAASGGSGSFTYQWRRTGTGSATLTNSNAATYNISSNASNYANTGTYYFNRYAKDDRCNTPWVAAQGTYTLKVEFLMPTYAKGNAWMCGGSSYIYSPPVKLPTCTGTIYTTSTTAPYCRSYTSGTATSYYYNAVYVEQNYATLCDNGWHMLTQAEAEDIKNNCAYADVGAHLGFMGWVKNAGTPESYGSRGYAWHNSNTSGGITIAKLLKLRDKKITASDNADNRSDGHQVICARSTPWQSQPQGGCTYTEPALAGTFENFPSAYSAATYVSLIDARDGRKYPVVKIGDRWVMARNLNYQEDLTWQASAKNPSTVTGSNPELTGHFWCPGGDDIYTTTSTRASCEVWGALYAWETAMMVDGKWSDDNRNTTTWGSEPTYGTNTGSGNANNGGRGANGRGICPPNWHIPADEEWGELLNAMESGKGTTHNTTAGIYWPGVDAGIRGKAACTAPAGITSGNTYVNDSQANWYYHVNSGTDVYGFRALPAGARTEEFLIGRGDHAYFWSSTASSDRGAWARMFATYGYNGEVFRDPQPRHGGYSVRCIRDCTADVSPGTITTASTTTMMSVTPKVTTGSASAASGGSGSFTYQWRRTGTSSATLTGSNATTYIIGSYEHDATPGTYYFNRYARDSYGCTSAWAAAQGTYTLKVGFVKPTHATGSTWTCGSSPYIYSSPVKLPACDHTAYTYSERQAYCRSYTSGGVTSYYYNTAYVKQHSATLCDNGWHLLTQAEANAVKNSCTYAEAAAHIGLMGWVKNAGTPESYGDRGYAWSDYTWADYTWGDFLPYLLKLRDGNITTSDYAGSFADGHQVLCAILQPPRNQPQGGCTYTEPQLVGTFKAFPKSYSASTYVTLTDARDNKNYPVVKIGGRWIMARNLNYQEGLTWQAKAAKPDDSHIVGHFWCPGEGLTSSSYSCEVWGALYTWETASMIDGKWTSSKHTSSDFAAPLTGTSGSNAESDGNHYHNHTLADDGGRDGRGICPPNWHIPTGKEWGKLLNAMESGNETAHSTNTGWRGWDAGARGKAACTAPMGITSGNTYVNDTQVIWYYHADNSGTDVYGFHVIPAGERTGSGFGGRGFYAHFWSSSAYDTRPVNPFTLANQAWARRFGYDKATVYHYGYEFSYGFSVRCMRDE